MKNNLLKICAFSMALFVLLIAVETGNAQTRRAVNISKQRLEQLLENIEEGTDHFSNQLNKSLDRSRLDGGKTEDNIADRAKDLENATDELRREFDHHDTRRENRPEARKVINSAMVIDRIMARRNFSRQAETSWVRLRSELNALAAIYGLPAVSSRANRR